MSPPAQLVQYIIMDPKQRMSTGKRAAQAAHAAVEGLALYDGGFEDRWVQRWRLGGHYAKVVLMADDLRVTYDYLTDRGFKVARIIDEARTELDGLTLTALGTQIVDKNHPHTAATFSTFKLYDDRPKLIVSEAMEAGSDAWYRRLFQPRKLR